MRDYSDVPEDGKIHLEIEDNIEWFANNTYDAYWTNSPHFFNIPERGKSKIVDSIRNAFGNDVAIMAVWVRGSITKNPGDKYVLKSEPNYGGVITDHDVIYLAVKKNKKKLQLISKYNEIELHKSNN